MNKGQNDRNFKTLYSKGMLVEMAKMDSKDLREKRKEWFSQMEAKLKEMHTKEDDSLFYYHSSEDRIVLSHAMFWTMTQLQCLKG